MVEWIYVLKGCCCCCRSFSFFSLFLLQSFGCTQLWTEEWLIDESDREGERVKKLGHVFYDLKENLIRKVMPKFVINSYLLQNSMKHQQQHWLFTRFFFRWKFLQRSSLIKKNAINKCWWDAGWTMTAGWDYYVHLRKLFFPLLSAHLQA